MIGGTLVSVIQAPNIPDIANFVVCTVEECREILCWLDKFREPNQGGQILLPSSKMRASQFDLVRFNRFALS